MKKWLFALCVLCFLIACTPEDAVNEDSKADLKVLLIGSSYGANSIMQFPILAKADTINILAGNYYQGSVSLAEIAGYCKDNKYFGGSWYHKYKDGMWQNKTKSTMKNLLKDEKWDVIIIQRSAEEGNKQPCLELKQKYNTLTTEEQKELDSLQTHAVDNWVANINTIKNYISANCTNNPKIYFNVTWADAFVYRYLESAKGKEKEEHGLEKLQYITQYLWNSAKEIKAKTNIELIPCAPIVQEVRNNEAYQKLGSWDCTVTQGDGTKYTFTDDNKMLTDDSQHLDAGVGCYVPGCVLYQTLLKYKNKNIINNKHLPTELEVGVQKFAAEENKNPHTFTPIPEEYAKDVREIVDRWFNNNTW